MDQQNGQDQQQLEGQEGQPQPVVEAPQEDDYEKALRVIQEREGYDPRLMKFQFDELRQRERDLERQRAEIQRQQREAERQSRWPDPSVDMMDPVQRSLFERLDRMERRQIEREEREQAELEQMQQIESQGAQLRQGFFSMMRQQGAPDPEIEKQAPVFFQTMEQLYPDGIPPMLGIEGAIRNTSMFMRAANGNGGSYQPRVTRGPRAEVVIPGTTGAPPAQNPAISDVGPQRQGETNEQYAQRVLRNFEALGMKGMGLRDGDRLSSE